MSQRRGGNQNIPRPDNWRLGEHPEWMKRDFSVLNDMEEISRRLHLHIASDQPANLDLKQEWVATSRPSAVLMPLLVTNDGPSVLLTRRADHLRSHKGEISFPGGRMEPNETPHQTALREAHEEVALELAVQHLRQEVQVAHERSLQDDRDVACVEELDGVRVGLASGSLALERQFNSETLNRQKWKG